jgi:hypothetical protein
MANKKIISIAFLVIIIVGVGSFYGGTVYEKNTATSQKSAQRGVNGQFAGANGQERGQRGPNGKGFVNGQITAKDDKSITVKEQDGSSKIVYFSNSTTVGKSVDGSATDLIVGEQVMVNGQSDAPGTVTAQNIQIRPIRPSNNNQSAQ